MRRFYLYLISLIAGVLNLQTASGQSIWFTSTPDSVADVNEQYVYDANVYSADSDTSFTLEEAPDGMSINGTNGLITWTPDNMTDGGKVVIRASNSGNSEIQEFYIYITGPPDCDPGTIAYWKLDETEGPTYKDSYGIHNASVSGQEPGDSAGVVGKCQKFTPWPFTEMNAPDHSDFDFDPDQSFSISFWFRTSEPDHDSTGVIIGRNDGADNAHWWVGVSPDNELWFYVRDETKGAPYYGARAHLSGLLLYNNPNTWHQGVAVHDADADRIRIYFDGSSETHFDIYNAHNSPGLSASSPLCIGYLKRGPGDGTQFPFHGSIDEVIMFSKALSTAEIDTLFNRGSSGRPACDKGNSAPLFKTEPAIVAYEDASYSYQFLANDIDADVLTYSVDKNPSWMTVNTGTRTLSGTPANNHVGSDSVVIKVNDGSIDIYQRFLLTVVNTNDPPVITSTGVTTVYEEQPYSYDVDADDDDAGDIVTFTLHTPTPGWLSVNASSGLITGTPPLDDTSSYTVTVRATDDSSAYDEQTYTLDILNINDAPEINGVVTPLDVDEDKTLLIELSDIDYTDVDNDAGELTLNVLGGTNYSAAANTITPDLNYSGTLSVNIEISDPDSTAEGQINVTVNPVNDPPEIITFPDETAWAEQSYAYVFNATDVDNLPGDLTYSIPVKPGWLTWVEVMRTLSGTPEFEDVGIDTLTIRVSDGTDNTDSTFYITVNTENNIPVITSTPVTAVNEDELYVYNITYEDADPGDIVILSYVIKPGWLNLNVAGKVLSGTPVNEHVGEHLVKLRVYDGKQDSTQTFHITVINSPDAPVIMGQNDTIGGYIGVPFDIEMDDLDVEDVDNLISELTLTVLPGTNYSLSGGNSITISGSVTDKLVEVNVRVSDPGSLFDEAVLYVKVLDFVGIRDLTKSNNLVEKTYPVPAETYIQFIINAVNDYKIRIIDITGKTVFEEKYTNNDRLVEISTGNMPSGLYIFEVKSKSVYQIGRITISDYK